MNKSTLKYIAKELGISASTVSRAVNCKSGVKSSTREKVLEAVKKYSYTPNEVARSLQKSSTETIAVVLPDISETFFGTIVKGIEHIVSKSGYMLFLADTNEKTEKEKKYLDILYKRRIDALVLATVDNDGFAVKKFLDNKIPVAFIDNIPNLDNINAITIDNEKAGKIATDYLISCGHKKIATIIGSEQETTGKERLKGYKNSLKLNKLNIEERLIKYGDYKLDSGYKAMNELLENSHNAPFSAVFVTSEQMTYGAIRAIRERNLSIPEDISIVGFDIHNLKDDRRQMITSVRQPEDVIGRRVGELLIEQLKSGNSHPANSKIFLDPFLEKGDTVRKIQD